MSNTITRKILNVSIPPELYKAVAKLAKAESKTKSEFARDALARYIERNERWKQIRRWGSQAARKLNIKNENDVEKLIENYRQERQRELSGK